MQESLFDLLGVEGIEMDPMAKVSIARDVCEVKIPALEMGFVFLKVSCALCWTFFCGLEVCCCG